MLSTSELPSFVLVCPSNCGSRTFTCSTQVRPSRMSSPDRVNPSFLSAFVFRAMSLIVRVSADLNPVRWVPPSCVLMLFTKVKVFSLRSEEHTSELQSHVNLVCRLLLEKKKKKKK